MENHFKRIPLTESLEWEDKRSFILLFNTFFQIYTVLFTRTRGFDQFLHFLSKNLGIILTPKNNSKLPFLIRFLSCKCPIVIKFSDSSDIKIHRPNLKCLYSKKITVQYTNNAYRKYIYEWKKASWQYIWIYIYIYIEATEGVL